MIGKMLNKNQWTDMLRDVAEKHVVDLLMHKDCDWYTGASATFAQSLLDTVVGDFDIYCIKDESGKVIHVCIYLNSIECYLDADGAMTKAELFSMLSEEQRLLPHSIHKIPDLHNFIIFSEIKRSCIKDLKDCLRDTLPIGVYALAVR